MSEEQNRALQDQLGNAGVVGTRLLFDRLETAGMLNISPATLSREMRAGRISYRRIGDKPLWTLDDIQEYIDSRKRKAGSK